MLIGEFSFEIGGYTYKFSENTIIIVITICYFNDSVHLDTGEFYKMQATNAKFGKKYIDVTVIFNFVKVQIKKINVFISSYFHNKPF